MAYKTYLHTNTFTTRFPIDFLQSKNEKIIQVKNCSFTNTGDSQKYIAKYNYIGTHPDFNVWFTDMNGNIINVDSFVLSLLLIY